MGQLADDMDSGMSCSGCGILFEREHGYPVLCEDCWTHLTLKERKMQPPKAIEPELGEEE